MPVVDGRASFEDVIDNALRFQRDLFRRAWGVFFVVWAFSIAIFSFGESFTDLLGLGSFRSLAVLVSAYVIVPIFCGYVTFATFRNVRETLRFDKILEPHRWSAFRKRMRLFLISWLLFYLAVWIGFSFFSVSSQSLLYASFSAAGLFIYIQLRFCFPASIPSEAKVAVIFYVLTVGLGVIASLLHAGLQQLPIAWGATVLIWLVCGVVGLRKSSSFG